MITQVQKRNIIKILVFLPFQFQVKEKTNSGLFLDELLTSFSEKYKAKIFCSRL